MHEVGVVGQAEGVGVLEETEAHIELPRRCDGLHRHVRVRVRAIG